MEVAIRTRCGTTRVRDLLFLKRHFDGEKEVDEKIGIVIVMRGKVGFKVG